MKHKEITVACAAELKDGEMKQVAVDGVNILLARVNGNIMRWGRLARTTARRSRKARWWRAHHLSLASRLLQRHDG